MQNVKLLILFFLSLGGFASAETFQVGAALSQVKMDRKVYLTRLQSLKVNGFTAEVLRSVLIEQVLCRIQTPIAAQACQKIQGHSSLDGQGPHDLSTFNLDAENLKVVISGLVGVLQAIQSSLREENLGQAQEILVSSGEAMLQLSNPSIAAQILSHSLEKNSLLFSEISRNQNLQIYSPLLEEIRAWLLSRPANLPERKVAVRLSIELRDVSCVLTTTGMVQCHKTFDAKEVPLSQEIKQRKFSSLIRADYPSHLCAQDENRKVVCQEGVFYDQPETKDGCVGTQIEPQRLNEVLIYTNSFSHGQWEIERYKEHHNAAKVQWAAKVYCAGVDEHRLYVLSKDRIVDLQSYRLLAEKSTDSSKISVREGTFDLSYFLNRYISVDRDGSFNAGAEFEWVQTPLFDGVPKSKIKALRTSENHLCLLFEGPVWNCLSVWDRKGAGITWNQFSYSLPAGEFSLSGPGVATQDQIYVSGSDILGDRKTLQIPRPAESHDFYFFRAPNKYGRDYFENIVCYLVKGEMQCQNFSQERYSYPQQNRMKGLKRLFYFPKNSYGRQLCGVTETTWICPGLEKVIQVPLKFRIPLEKMEIFSNGVCLLEKGDQVSCLSRTGEVKKLNIDLSPGDHIRRFLKGHDLCLETDREIHCEDYEGSFSVQKVSDLVREGAR